MPEPYAVPAGKDDDFRSFVLPLPLERDVAVAAVEFRPGNRRIVHHARFYIDPSDQCRRLDAAEPGPGYVAFESGGEPLVKPGLGAWVPGPSTRLPPEGVGKVVRKGSDLVLLIHYHGTGKTETDRSSIGLYLCKTPPRRQILHIPMSTKKIDIPPGDQRHRMTLSYRVAADAHAISLIPHGHQLLREISVTATLPGGKIVPMLWIDDWDFNWQGQYYFARPSPLPKGTRLDLVAYYDNSDGNPSNPFHPPRRVTYGTESDAEMLGCHIQILADDEEVAGLREGTAAESRIGCGPTRFPSRTLYTMASLDRLYSEWHVPTPNLFQGKILRFEDSGPKSEAVDASYLQTSMSPNRASGR